MLNKPITVVMTRSYPIVRSRAMRTMSTAIGEECLVQEHIQEERFGTRIERRCLAARDAKHQEDEMMALCGILSKQEGQDDRLEEARDEVRLILRGTGGGDLSPDAIETLVRWKVASL